MIHTNAKRAAAFVLAAALVVTGITIPQHTSAETKDNTFNVLSLNVAGLPAILSSSDPAVNTVQMSPLLNNYDIVSVQEDILGLNLKPVCPAGQPSETMSKLQVYYPSHREWSEARTYMFYQSS